jgi:hypothetical protein
MTYIHSTVQAVRYLSATRLCQTPDEVSEAKTAQAGRDDQRPDGGQIQRQFKVSMEERFCQMATLHRSIVEEEELGLREPNRWAWSL